MDHTVRSGVLDRPLWRGTPNRSNEIPLTPCYPLNRLSSIQLIFILKEEVDLISITRRLDSNTNSRI